MQTLFTKIQQFCIDHNLITPGSKIVVGFSGGPDSMLLLYFLNSIKHTHNLSLLAVHLDHGWRESSASEAVFCKEVCDKLDIAFLSARLNELPLPPEKLKGSKEEVGRHARRFLLEQVAHEHNANSIALGQHFDDQEETFFIRLIRGSTLSGLTGIKPQEGMYIRPLLSLMKKEVLTHLDKQGITYIKDPSNEHDAYLRNKIRKYVIPALRQVDDRFDHNFKRTLTSLQETEDYLKTHTQEVFDRIAQHEHDCWMLQSDKLLTLHPYMQHRILLMWLIKNNVSFVPTESFLDEIIRFIEQSGSKTHTLHERWSIVKKKNVIFIEKL
ncbi:MAG: tRNA lysidine(34) synthetase TilS [Candidatus Babeliales bacterium]